MIAIGILAVGLVILLSLFPAAMTINRQTTRNVLGMIICENGISLVRSVFASGAVPEPEEESQLDILADYDIDNIFAPEQCRFPQGDMGTDMGFLLLYRTLFRGDPGDATGKGHQLVAVSYRQRVGGDVSFRSTGSNITADVDKPVLKEGRYFTLGTPVIHKKTGEYVIVRQVSQIGYDWTNLANVTQAVVHRVPSVDWVRGDDAYAAFVVLEDNEYRFSPAMAVLETELSLDWEWD